MVHSFVHSNPNGENCLEGKEIRLLADLDLWYRRVLWLLFPCLPHYFAFLQDLEGHEWEGISPEMKVF